MKLPRRFSTEEKLQLIRRIEASEPVSGLTKEMGILRESFCQWLAAYRVSGASGLNRKRRPKPGSERTRDASAAMESPFFIKEHA